APPHLLAQVRLQGRGVRRQAREDEAAERRRAELPRPVLGLAERGRHPAPAVRPLLERDADEVALEVVGPGVIDALEPLGRPRVLERDERAAVRAPVLEGVEGAVLAAYDDDGHLAHEGGAVVAGPRDVGLEADVVPDGAFEDAAELGAIVRLVLVDPVGHAGEGLHGPGAGRGGSRHAGPPSRERVTDRHARHHGPDRPPGRIAHAPWRAFEHARSTRPVRYWRSTAVSGRWLAGNGARPRLQDE